jgi:hypothetical protein
MARRAIDLEGLPEEAVRDVEAYVASVQKQYERKARGQRSLPRRDRVHFDVQPGTVYGNLTREDIYEDER